MPVKLRHGPFFVVAALSNAGASHALGIPESCGWRFSDVRERSRNRFGIDVVDTLDRVVVAHCYQTASLDVVKRNQRLRFPLPRSPARLAGAVKSVLR